MRKIRRISDLTLKISRLGTDISSNLSACRLLTFLTDYPSYSFSLFHPCLLLTCSLPAPLQIRFYRQGEGKEQVSYK